MGADQGRDEVWQPQKTHAFFRMVWYRSRASSSRSLISTSRPLPVQAQAHSAVREGFRSERALGRRLLSIPIFVDEHALADQDEIGHLAGDRAATDRDDLSQGHPRQAD